jgi:uncharacterized membrane protein YhaH (DUF805 family)
MKRHWFSTSIRRGRLSYLISVSIATALWSSKEFFRPFDQPLNASLFLLPFFVAIMLLTAQRMRDFNVTGWLVVAWYPISVQADVTFYMWDRSFSYLSFIVPILVALIPGTKGPNRYGD